MTLSEYSDLFIKGLVAFAIPVAWVIIFYSFIKKTKRSWRVLVITASMFSFLTLVLKEVMDQVIPVFDQIITYALGMFFGIAGISFLFNVKSRWLESAPKSDVFYRDYKVKQRVHMRHLFQAAILIEENGEKFYNKLAAKTPDADMKNLCFKLASDEIEHKKLFQDILERWLPLPAEKETLDSLIEGLRSRGLFLDPPGEGATEEQMVRYAVEQEKTTASFYLSFEKFFPTAWQRMHIQHLVMEERVHANKLISAYPQYQIS